MKAVPAPEADFVARHTTTVSLTDGTRVRIRPITPSDKENLVEGFHRLSPESRYRRFMTNLDELTPEMLAYLTEIDYVDHFAWLAIAADEVEQPGIGVARYVRLEDDPASAEAAIAVTDDYQGRGVGTVLLQALGATALANGVRYFVGYALPENKPVIELLEQDGAQIEHGGPGEVRFRIDLPQKEETLKGSSLYRALRAAARGEMRPLRPFMMRLFRRD
jgi:GNAT superfamily N-acetyltransferase